MTEKLQIYKCDICGNIVEMIHNGVGQLVCCGQPMKLMKENITDASTEKHIPVIEKTPDGIKVKVGSTPHPMEEKHFIEWIEIIKDGQTCKHFLKPGTLPETLFNIQDDNIIVREYCNVHGLWKK